MIDVGRNDRPPLGHFTTHKFRRYVIWNMCAKTLAVAAQGLLCRLPADIFADGDIFHFRRDDACAGIGELGDGLTRIRPKGHVANRKFRCQPFPRGKAVILRPHDPPLIGGHITTRRDPALPQARQAAIDRDRMSRVRIGSGTVINGDGRFARCRMEVDFAHRHADLGVTRACDMDLAGGGKRSRSDDGLVWFCGNIHS